MKVPKYFQVKQDILDLIAGLQPGAGVPTERELAERFATSRTTVRQAIAELVVDGRLERTQGRGTFVAQPKLMQVRQLTSFSQDLQDEGRHPGSVVRDLSEREADREVAEHLRIPVGSPYWRLERVRLTADEPIAHEIAHLAGPFPDLPAELAPRGSLYKTFREAYGLELAAVEDVIETALADPLQASLLGVDTGLPMLLIHRTGWDADGRVREWTRCVFRGDRFRFVARNERGPADQQTPQGGPPTS
ncbi:GntR family transcriptional regulator [Nakamurella flava]|uniref:GntR family transcriptional regulator n=1 Tax=Nakamurella flava TaxID=2576308 RepID=A0A4U6QE77_9ACTN|nr:GntR family transcriptional regulator [Nakamurella flava]TKV58348.1 GntR family transcriptional regulator [Nakamurella flava]